MSGELEPRDDAAALRNAIRMRNTQEIAEILRTLKPQIDGSFGPVNPRLIEVYFKGLEHIAKLHRVYDPEPERPDELTPDREEAILREVAAKQLAELSDRQHGS